MGYSVEYARERVAQLIHGTHDRLGLRFEPGYRSQPARPVLSLSFEDDLRRDYWGPGSNRLPNYLGNLLPEGQLRELIRNQYGFPESDESALLASIGHDLPGAVVFREDELAASSELHVPGQEGEHRDSPSPEAGLRFSLAGVQLKFSMLMADRKLHLPAQGQDGDWIVKLSFEDFPGLPENEHAVMTWARLLGWEVPETKIVEAVELIGLGPYVDRDFRALAVKRYDRTPSGRIHQEDFAQVLNRPSGAKYDGKLEQILVVTMKVLGYEAYLELLSRVVFSVASGNFDAHLKNWSLFYPDPCRPSLAPLYDQVATVAWPRVERKLALSLSGKRSAETITSESFGKLAKKLGCCDDACREAIELAESTVLRARDAWSEIREMLPAQHQTELVEHWKRVPLLKASGGID